MPGGILELIAYGRQDFINIESEYFTPFKAVLRKNIPFAIKNLETSLPVNFDSVSIHKIYNCGDLLKDIIIKLETPELEFDYKVPPLFVINNLLLNDINVDFCYYNLYKLKLLNIIKNKSIYTSNILLNNNNKTFVIIKYLELYNFVNYKELYKYFFDNFKLSLQDILNYDNTKNKVIISAEKTLANEVITYETIASYAINNSTYYYEELYTNLSENVEFIENAIINLLIINTPKYFLYNSISYNTNTETILSSYNFYMNKFKNKLLHTIIKDNEIFSYNKIIHSPPNDILMLSFEDVYIYTFKINYTHIPEFYIIIKYNDIIKNVLFKLNNSTNTILYCVSYDNLNTTNNSVDINNDYLIYDFLNPLPIYKYYATDSNVIYFEIKHKYILENDSSINIFTINSVIGLFTTIDNESYFNKVQELYPKLLYLITKIEIDVDQQITKIEVKYVPKNTLSINDNIYLPSTNKTIPLLSITKNYLNTDVIINYKAYIETQAISSFSNNEIITNLETILLDTIKNNLNYLLNVYKNIFNPNNYLIQINELFYDPITTTYIQPVYNKNSNINKIISYVLNYLSNSEKNDTLLYKDFNNTNYNILYNFITDTFNTFNTSYLKNSITFSNNFYIFSNINITSLLKTISLYTFPISEPLYLSNIVLEDSLTFEYLYVRYLNSSPIPDNISNYQGKLISKEYTLTKIDENNNFNLLLEINNIDLKNPSLCKIGSKNTCYIVDDNRLLYKIGTQYNNNIKLNLKINLIPVIYFDNITRIPFNNIIKCIFLDNIIYILHEELNHSSVLIKYTPLGIPVIENFNITINNIFSIQDNLCLCSSINNNKYLTTFENKLPTYINKKLIFSNVKNIFYDNNNIFIIDNKSIYLNNLVLDMSFIFDTYYDYENFSVLDIFINNNKIFLYTRLASTKYTDSEDIYQLITLNLIDNLNYTFDIILLTNIKLEVPLKIQLFNNDNFIYIFNNRLEIIEQNIITKSYYYFRDIYNTITYDAITMNYKYIIILYNNKDTIECNYLINVYNIESIFLSNECRSISILNNTTNNSIQSINIYYDNFIVNTHDTIYIYDLITLTLCNSIIINTKDIINSIVLNSTTYYVITSSKLLYYNDNTKLEIDNTYYYNYYDEDIQFFIDNFYIIDYKQARIIYGNYNIESDKINIFNIDSINILSKYKFIVLSSSIYFLIIDSTKLKKYITNNNKYYFQEDNTIIKYIVNANLYNNIITVIDYKSITLYSTTDYSIIKQNTIAGLISYHKYEILMYNLDYYLIENKNKILKLINNVANNYLLGYSLNIAYDYNLIYHSNISAIYTVFDDLIIYCKSTNELYYYFNNNIIKLYVPQFTLMTVSNDCICFLIGNVIVSYCFNDIGILKHKQYTIESTRLLTYLNMYSFYNYLFFNSKYNIYCYTRDDYKLAYIISSTISNDLDEIINLSYKDNKLYISYYETIKIYNIITSISNIYIQPFTVLNIKNAKIAYPLLFDINLQSKNEIILSYKKNNILLSALKPMQLENNIYLLSYKNIKYAEDVFYFSFDNKNLRLEIDTGVEIINFETMNLYYGASYDGIKYTNSTSIENSIIINKFNLTNNNYNLLPNFIIDSCSLDIYTTVNNNYYCNTKIYEYYLGSNIIFDIILHSINHTTLQLKINYELTLVCLTKVMSEEYLVINNNITDIKFTEITKYNTRTEVFDINNNRYSFVLDTYLSVYAINLLTSIVVIFNNTYYSLDIEYLNYSTSTSSLITLYYKIHSDLFTNQTDEIYIYIKNNLSSSWSIAYYDGTNLNIYYILYDKLIWKNIPSCFLQSSIVNSITICDIKYNKYVSEIDTSNLNVDSTIYNCNVLILDYLRYLYNTLTIDKTNINITLINILSDIFSSQRDVLIYNDNIIIKDTERPVYTDIFNIINNTKYNRIYIKLSNNFNNIISYHTINLQIHKKIKNILLSKYYILINTFDNNNYDDIVKIIKYNYYPLNDIIDFIYYYIKQLIILSESQDNIIINSSYSLVNNLHNYKSYYNIICNKYKLIEWNIIEHIILQLHNDMMNIHHFLHQKYITIDKTYCLINNEFINKITVTTNILYLNELSDNTIINYILLVIQNIASRYPFINIININKNIEDDFTTMISTIFNNNLGISISQHIDTINDEYIDMHNITYNNNDALGLPYTYYIYNINQIINYVNINNNSILSNLDDYNNNKNILRLFDIDITNIKANFISYVESYIMPIVVEHKSQHIIVVNNTDFITLNTYLIINKIYYEIINIDYDNKQITINNSNNNIINNNDTINIVGFNNNIASSNNIIIALYNELYNNLLNVHNIIKKDSNEYSYKYECSNLLLKSKYYITDTHILEDCFTTIFNPSYDNLTINYNCNTLEFLLDTNHKRYQILYLIYKLNNYIYDYKFNFDSFINEVNLDNLNLDYNGASYSKTLIKKVSLLNNNDNIIRDDKYYYLSKYYINTYIYPYLNVDRKNNFNNNILLQNNVVTVAIKLNDIYRITNAFYHYYKKIKRNDLYSKEIEDIYKYDNLQRIISVNKLLNILTFVNNNTFDLNISVYGHYYKDTIITPLERIEYYKLLIFSVIIWNILYSIDNSLIPMKYVSEERSYNTKYNYETIEVCNTLPDISNYITYFNDETLNIIDAIDIFYEKTWNRIIENNNDISTICTIVQSFNYNLLAFCLSKKIQFKINDLFFYGDDINNYKVGYYSKEVIDFIKYQQSINDWDGYINVYDENKNSIRILKIYLCNNLQLAQALKVPYNFLYKLYDDKIYFINYLLLIFLSHTNNKINNYFIDNNKLIKRYSTLYLINNRLVRTTSLPQYYYYEIINSYLTINKVSIINNNIPKYNIIINNIINFSKIKDTKYLNNNYIINSIKDNYILVNTSDVNILVNDYVYYLKNNIIYYLLVDQIIDNKVYYKNDIQYIENNTDNINIYELVLYSGIYNLILLIYSNNACRYMSPLYILDNYNDYYTISNKLKIYIDELRSDDNWLYKVTNFRYYNDYIDDLFKKITNDNDISNLNDSISLVKDYESTLLSSTLYPYSLHNPSKPLGNWIKYLGHNIIDYIEFYIGEEVIQKITGDYLHINYSNSVSRQKTKKYLQYIGYTKEFLTPNNYLNKGLLYLIIPWFFNNTISNALPLISLNNTNVNIKIKFSKLDDLLVVNTSNCKYNIISKFSGSLLSDYIFLCDDDRNKFINSRHEYLIEQIQYETHMYSNQSDILIKLNFKNCVKDIHWTCQTSTNLKNKDYSNYTLSESNYNIEILSELNNLYLYKNKIKNFNNIFDNLINKFGNDIDIRNVNSSWFSDNIFINTNITEYNNSRSLIVNTQFNLDGNAILSDLINTHDNIALLNNILKIGSIIKNKYYNKTIDVTDSLYSNYLTLINYANSGDVISNAMYTNYVIPWSKYNNNRENGLHSYSFSLYPNDMQNSGSLNFSVINDFRLKIKLDENAIKSNTFLVIKVYAKSYNILRIFSGLGGCIY